MPYTAVHVLDKKTGASVVSLHLVLGTSEECAQWEELVAAATKELWSGDGAEVHCVPAATRLAGVLNLDHLVLILVGEEDVDELCLAEALPGLEAVIAGVVGGALTADAVASMHGKVAVALGEVFHMGHRVHSDADTVLKLAKMKPLA